MCVLPYVKELNDPLKHLYLLLMEAFCKEHAIRMVKMASMEGFCVLLKLLRTMDPANPYATGGGCDADITDQSDVLIIKVNSINIQKYLSILFIINQILSKEVINF